MACSRTSNCGYGIALSILLLSVFAHAVKGQPAASMLYQGQDKPTIQVEPARGSGLLPRVQAAGVVPVMIQLSEVAIEETMWAEKLHDREAGIARIQQRLIGEMQGVQKSGEALPVRRYRYTPFLALQATEEVLVHLLDSELVTEIFEDAVHSTMLSESTTAIGADAAWAYGGTGIGQSVVVIDTGVDQDHPFLAGKVVREACFSTNYVSGASDFRSYSICPGEKEEAYGSRVALDCGTDVSGCGHGTRVAGIVAGEGDVFSGVAPDAQIVAVQVFSRFESYCGDVSCARSWVSDQVAGLEYVYSIKDSIDIAAVNMSLGGGHYTSVERCDQVNPAMRSVFQLLHDANIAVIAAAGNSGQADGLVAPACLSQAISVGSTNNQDSVSVFSSSADFLDFFAPGEDIQTSVPGGGYQSGSGTSFSTPHLAGAWAILKSRSPDATIGEIKEAFYKTGVDILDGRNEAMVSRIQVDRALYYALLPVELVRFEALAHSRSIQLDWETASETNNAGFEVQHLWAGEFTTIDFVPGGGTRDSSRSYSYTVANLAPGTHAFRLKQIDFNGAITYTQTIEGDVELSEAYHMGSSYPNPFNPTTQFTLTLARKQHTRIAVYNILGERVAMLEDAVLEPRQMHIYTLEASHLPSGVYLIQAIGEYFKVTRKATLVK